MPGANEMEDTVLLTCVCVCVLVSLYVRLYGELDNIVLSLSNGVIKEQIYNRPLVMPYLPIHMFIRPE